MHGSSARFALALAMLSLGLGNPRARADSTNIVANGGFENGDLTGWTESGNNLGVCFPAVFVSGLNQTTSFCNHFTFAFPAHNGTYAAFFANATHLGTGTISQVLSTTPGTTYNLTFWLATFRDPFNMAIMPNQLIVDWGGRQVVDLTNLNTNGNYVGYSISVSATGNQTTLSFLGTNDPSVTGFDDVSVVATPEPSSLILLCTGLLSVAIIFLKDAIPYRTCPVSAAGSGGRRNTCLQFTRSSFRSLRFFSGVGSSAARPGRAMCPVQSVTYVSGRTISVASP